MQLQSPGIVRSNGRSASRDKKNFAGHMKLINIRRPTKLDGFVSF